jgi:hypothetical protein
LTSVSLEQEKRQQVSVKAKSKAQDAVNGLFLRPFADTPQLRKKAEASLKEFRF